MRIKKEEATPLIQAAILDLRGAACLLGMTEKGLRRQVERGRVPYRRLGRKLIFVRSEIESWFQRLPGLTLEEVDAIRERRNG